MLAGRQARPPDLRAIQAAASAEADAAAAAVPGAAAAVVVAAVPGAAVVVAAPVAYACRAGCGEAGRAHESVRCRVRRVQAAGAAARVAARRFGGKCVKHS